VGGATGRWLYSAQLAERNAARYGDRYRIQRYESLVADPVGQARELAAFVGESFEPRMLEMGDMPTYRAKLEAGRDGRDGPLITDAFVGIHRGRIAEPELAFMQSRAGSVMERHGYALDPVPMSRGARLRFALVDWPLNAARMLAWSIRTQLARAVPRIAGRRPPAHHRAA
jgi:hypothetical protein